jgi:hypothetical protein
MAWVSLPSVPSGALKITYRALLGAVLENDAVAAYGIGDGTTLGNRVGDWFFQIDMFSRADGSQSQQRVPVIRRGDGYGIDIFARKKLAEILIGRTGALALDRLRLFSRRGSTSTMHIAYGDELRLRIFSPLVYMVAAVATDADHRELDLFGGRQGVPAQQKIRCWRGSSCPSAQTERRPHAAQSVQESATGYRLPFTVRLRFSMSGKVGASAVVRSAVLDEIYRH